MRSLRRLCAAFVVVASFAGCTAEAPTPDAVPDDDMVSAEESMQPRELVDLTIYFRQKQGRDVHLKPVLREVPINDDLPRTALGLLLDGPTRNDPPQLRPPLPTTTRVTKFAVRKGTASVQLSGKAVADAHRVGKRSDHEVLALAAVANTLTEFPDIERVRLRVKGRGQRFWGGWGLPDLLVRDDSLVGPQPRLSIPPLDGFGRRPKQMGVGQGRRRRPPAVAAVRVQSLTTYLRVTVEVTSAKGGPLRGPVPPTSVRRRGKNIVLRVRGDAARKVSGSLAKQLRDPAFRGGRVRITRQPRAVVVRLAARRPTQFWLHTLSEPARIVLDIRR